MTANSTDPRTNTSVPPKSKGGRPKKSVKEKYRPTYIKFHPSILEWAKEEAEKRGIGYQTVINQTLLEHISS